ncbi:MAG: hypothetical protein QOK42_386, partial [Frankiaceae bacterium]|nr:hypothetical protein [Frankiaceae bacterium]
MPRQYGYVVRRSPPAWSSVRREVELLKGDLAATPLVEVLRTLADEGATGCLRVSDVEGEEASVYVKGGFIYSVAVPGRRPQLGARLVSSGALAPEALAEALEAQRDELQGWRLGELLVHLGFVEQTVVEAFVTEQLRDGITDLLRWQDGRWRFRKNDKTREDVAPPMAIDELLAAVEEREGEWAGILQEVHAPTAIPVLSTRGTASPEMMLDGDSWSLLCKIDGERSIAELARDAGLTLFEAGRVVVALVQAGLVDVEETVEPALSVVTGPEPVTTTAVEEDQQEPPADMAMRLAAAFSTPEEPAQDIAEPVPAEPYEALAEAAATSDMSEIAALVTEAVLSSPAAVGGDPRDELSASIARVSAALSDLLGSSPAQQGQDVFDLPPGLRKPPKPAPSSRTKKRTADDERRDRLRAAAAAELASAHAEAEAGRSQGNGSLADVVSLDSRRHERADEADGAALEAERVAAEEEAARLEAERAEAERIAAEEEAARLEAERLEAERIAAEEEAARLEAERLEAEHAEAERIAAEEEAARLEAERVAAEAEAARL